MRRAMLLLTLASLSSPGIGTASAVEAVYTLRPVAAGAEVEALQVSLRLRGLAAGAGCAIVEMPLVASNVPTVAASLDSLEAQDATGPLGLEARDVGTAPATRRRWFATRAVAGDVQIRYSARPARVDAPRGASPPLDLRAEGGAISGSGAVSLLHPADEHVRLRLEWDLSAVPAGSTALHSPLPPFAADAEHNLDEVYFMAGALHRYPEEQPGQGFAAAWQGNPPFDARSLMQWSSDLYRRYERFFGTDPAPYVVFLRRNPVNAGGGMGMHRSFIVTFGAGGGADPAELKFTLAHEMFHTFQPRLTAPETQGGELAASWFNEGLAVYYEHVLPLRFGLIDADAFLTDLNFSAARYYTNALGNVPNAAVPARFWADTRIRTLPYDRGFLYFVTVDEAIRRASSGRKTLDDLMLAMKARERANPAPLTALDWSALLRHELGAGAVRAFERSLAGETPLPSSDAFGPCFRRISVPLRRYELGFEPAVLTESPRIVRGLVPGSAADVAGLRNGDEILRPVPQDRIQGLQSERLQLSIRRGKSTQEIEYLPRGETVAAWQWKRVQRRARRVGELCRFEGPSAQ